MVNPKPNFNFKPSLNPNRAHKHNQTHNYTHKYILQEPPTTSIYSSTEQKQHQFRIHDTHLNMHKLPGQTLQQTTNTHSHTKRNIPNTHKYTHNRSTPLRNKFKNLIPNRTIHKQLNKQANISDNKLANVAQLGEAAAQYSAG